MVGVVLFLSSGRGTHRDTAHVLPLDAVAAEAIVLKGRLLVRDLERKARKSVATPDSGEIWQSLDNHFGVYHISIATSRIFLKDTVQTFFRITYSFCIADALEPDWMSGA